MRKPNSFYLRLSWCLLTGAIAFVSLLPGANLHDSTLGVYINADWAHFLAYAAITTLPVLAWRLRTGLALSAGIVILSVGLQLLRGLLSDRIIDLEGSVINFLGIVAGILLGLNILNLRGRLKRNLISSADRSALILP